MFDFIVLILTLASSMIQFWLAIVSLQRRQTAGLRAFRLLVLTGGLWSATYAAQLIGHLSSPGGTLNLWAYMMQGLGGLMPTAYLLLVLQFTLPTRYAQRRSVMILLYVFPVFSLGLMLTIGLTRSWANAQAVFDLWLPAHMTYIYIVMLVSIILALRQITLAGPGHRRQFLALAVIGLIPLSTELLQLLVLDLTGRWLLELTPASSGLAAFIGAQFVFQLNWLDVIPVAYERAVLNMAEGVIVLDRSGVIHSCNEAAVALSGVAHESDLVGNTIEEISDALPFLTIAIIKGTAQPQRVVHGDCTLEVTNHPLLDERQETIGSLVMLRDVTAQVQTENMRLKLELDRQQLGFVRDFVGDVSHDFFTSLTVINTYTTLADRLAANAKQSDYLALCKEHATRLETMVRNMLTIVKLNQETLEPEDFESVVISTLVQHTLKRWRPDMRRKRQQLVTHLPPQYCELVCEPQQLELAISNVVENAVNYTPEEGTITVTVAPMPMHVRITISDTGPGIAPEDLPHIFDRFYRAEKHRPTTASSGLGLSITQRVVEAHNGTVNVESTQGEGSTFILTLPTDQPQIVVY